MYHVLLTIHLFKDAKDLAKCWNVRVRWNFSVLDVSSDGPLLGMGEEAQKIIRVLVGSVVQDFGRARDLRLGERMCVPWCFLRSFKVPLRLLMVHNKSFS